MLIHPFSSLLSAYGMGLADIRATRQQAIEEPFGDEVRATIDEVGERLGDDTRATKSPARACRSGRIKVHVRAHIRYAGTDTALVVPQVAATLAAGSSRAAHGRTSQPIR